MAPLNFQISLVSQNFSPYFMYRPKQPNWDFWHAIHCRNWAICLPLWFYVKLIFANFRTPKTAVLTILEALNIRFWKKFTLENVKSTPKYKIAQMVKMAVFGASKWPKVTSRKIWVEEKSWNFHIVYSQLGCPGLYL